MTFVQKQLKGEKRDRERERERKNREKDRREEKIIGFYVKNPAERIEIKKKEKTTRQERRIATMRK